VISKTSLIFIYNVLLSLSTLKIVVSQGMTQDV